MVKRDENQRKIREIAKHFSHIMIELGLDLRDPEMEKTPERVAKAYVNDLFSGLNPNNAPTLTTFPNKNNYDQLIALTNVELYSTCQHHFLPFSINVSIAYIPSKQYVGISKLVRVSKYFSKKPQTQELFVADVCNYLEKHLKPLGLMIYCEGKHFCMICRGVEKSGATMITSELKGLFRKNLSLEGKFINMIMNSRH